MIEELIQEKKWLLVRVGIGVVAFAIFCLLHLQILFNTFEIKRSTKTLRASVQEAYSWAEVTSNLKKNNKKLSERLQDLSDDLPENKVQSGIISVLNETAAKNHLKFKYLKPVDSIISGGYKEETFELMLTGFFHNTVKFINTLEQSENVIYVRALEMSAGGLVTNTLQVRIRLSVLQIDEI